MRKRLSNKPIGSRAFGRRDLLVLITVFGLGLLVLSSMLAKARIKAHRITCDNHLKQIGLGFHTWARDNGGSFPMGLSTNSHGAREYIESGNVFRVFQLMSNELSTPGVLVCPSDTRKPAKSFDQNLGNSNLSYFVALLSSNSTSSQMSLSPMFLSGDRNIQGGTKLPHGVLEFATNSPITWGPGMHNGQGNIALADGSAQGYNDAGLRTGLMGSGDTNRLVIP